MKLKELHWEAVKNAIPRTRGEAQWFLWWYRTLLKSQQKEG